ncbi:helix-turn-helix transcriptional regulator [Georgenia sp. 10Sc9-8]|uniref:Helix-turn-helix transcriptional regulator n=1 Tax=Georgenia halotolerans TaxID=3028317 RepID=A0ABT5TVG1_9MICO|nr:helix-turn-helix transcriptional regulator [Georgenia halotolerans]
MRDEDLIDHWLDLAHEVLGSLDGDLPWPEIGILLTDQLHSALAGRLSWATTDRTHTGPDVPAVDAASVPSDPGFDVADLARRAPVLHPLARHYAATGTADVLTLADVPPPTDANGREYLAELVAHGIVEQLWVPLPRRGTHARVGGVCRPDEPYRPDEHTHARRVQKVLRLLVAHTDVLTLWRCGLLDPEGSENAREVVDDLRLTGRQLAVLTLAAHGLTTAAVAHRLGMSPRTAEKHLENAYRQLGVSDRVSAVRRAELLGLIGDQAPEVPR